MIKAFSNILDYDWLKLNKYETSKLGEFESSNFISGNHGEYDVAKGHYVCWDPYPEAASAEA